MRIAVVAGLLLALVGALAEPVGQVATEPDPQLPSARPGLALRRAVAWLEAGDVAKAQPLLVAIAADHPILADQADLFRLQLLVDSVRYAEAVALQEQALHEGSPTRAEVFELLGRAHAALGS